MGCKEKYIPCGIVDEESAALNITFGSSYKTIVSDSKEWNETLGSNKPFLF